MRMYNGIRCMEDVIDYIESHITEPLNFEAVLPMVNLSLYEFRRIFSFVVGCPISEYIRKRKLSLAALEILGEEHPDILAISEKYGYANQSSFSRAFSEYHGVAPTACIGKNVKINLFTRPKFEFNLIGRENVPLKIIRTDALKIQGFSAASALTDTCCCDDVWNAFFESSFSKNIKSEHLYVAYYHHGDTVHCHIGEPGDIGETIPAGRWACFTMTTVDDDIVNQQYSKILYELLPSANLVRDEEKPTVEVYPSDMSQNGFEWEIRIPIKD